MIGNSLQYLYDILVLEDEEIKIEQNLSDGGNGSEEYGGAKDPFPVGQKPFRDESEWRSRVTRPLNVLFLKEIIHDERKEEAREAA